MKRLEFIMAGYLEAPPPSMTINRLGIGGWSNGAFMTEYCLLS
jgi:hypothetical protein